MHSIVAKTAVARWCRGMTCARPSLTSSPDTLPRMPAWVTSRQFETPEDGAFLSGAALTHLQVVVNCNEVPKVLLRERLALCAAEACVIHSGRMERAAELRDAVGFLLPDDSPGRATSD